MWRDLVAVAAARATGMKGKGRRESEGSKSCQSPSGQSPTSAEKRLGTESISSLLEVEPEPVPGMEQEVFGAEGPGPEEMPSDTESPETLEKQLDVPQGLLGMDNPDLAGVPGGPPWPRAESPAAGAAGVGGSSPQARRLPESDFQTHARVAAAGTWAAERRECGTRGAATA